MSDRVSSFRSLRAALDACDGIFVMVDARDPQAFHCKWIVDEMRARGLPRLSAMAKVDLVPRLSAKNWVASLDPGLWTVGVDLTRPESAAAIVRKLIRDYGCGAQRIACIGAPGTGKTTLCGIVGAPLFDTEGWHWAADSVSIALAGGFAYRAGAQALALAFLSRVEDGGLRALGLTAEAAGEHLVGRLRRGELRWYVPAPVPRDDSFLWKRQWRILLDSCSHIADGYIRLTPGAGAERGPECTE